MVLTKIKIAKGMEDRKLKKYVGIGLDERTGYAGQEILYDGLRCFEEGAFFTPYLACIGALLSKGDIPLPYTFMFNKEVRRFAGFLTRLREGGWIERTDISPTEEFEEKLVYKTFLRKGKELAENWKKVPSKIKEIADELALDIAEVPKHTNIKEERLKKILENKNFASHEEVDELEKFFGKKNY